VVQPEGAQKRRVSSGPPYDDLLQGLREAAPGAVARLCECFGPKLNRFAQAWLVGDGAAAEEVTVLALLDAIRNIDRFDPCRSSFSAWLFGIARRKIQDEVRRRRRRRSIPTASQVPLEAVAESPVDEDMAEVLSSRITAHRQVAALATVLSSLEFEVLMLSSADELSAPEIGRIVGRSGRAIHSILHRARGKARERLVRDG
jgi:RNA polymerase sigma-70 factor (ECF subfamily)